MVLELQEGKGKKSTVLLDGEFYCRCYPKDLQNAGITEGEEVEASALSRLNREVFLPRAKKRSLFLLNKKRYTRQEMVKKLGADGYPEETVTETLLYLQKLRYIEDTSYAQGYALSLLTKCSKRELYQKMLQKGFDKELIDIAIKEAEKEYLPENENGEETEAPELSAIRTYLRKKGYRPEQATDEKKKKMMMSLYRRGFSLSDIRKVIGETEETEWME